MEEAEKKVPFYYTPRPYQKKSWELRLSGEIDYYFRLWHRQCFAGNTPVLTEHGFKNIKDVKPGERVYSAHITETGVEYEMQEVTDIWRSPYEKPCIALGDIVVSYDHPFFDGQGYSPLYRIVWRAMDANQRNRLALLCQQYGQSLEPGLLSQGEVGFTETIQDRQSTQAWQGIPSGEAVSSRRNLGKTESASIGSRTLDSQPGESSTGKPYQRRHDGQPGGKPGMVHQHVQSTTLQSELRQDELGSSESDSQGIRKLDWQQGFVLYGMGSEDGNVHRLHQERYQSQDLEILESQELFDITVAVNHNLIVGIRRVIAANCGKDTDDIQFALFNSWTHPGTQTAYIGIDNKWINRNIWNKYIDGRRHWDNYPKEEDGGIRVSETRQIVYCQNNPEGLAPALIQFIGFKESESLIGSSYDSWFVSELSLYRRGAFDFIQPIWDNRKAMGLPLSVSFNFTPRGISNIAADMLRTYTGEDDPALWPGKHGRVYVDYLPADKSTKEDGTRLYSDEMLEDIRQRYIRAYGNDNLFRQEMMCEFLAVNAGLVYPAIEILRKENRYTKFNLRTDKPVYMAWDISSKDKQTDWTSCVVFQYYDGKVFVYDVFENNRKAVVECVQELSARPYFHLIRAACLPWDADRSGSRNSPLEECRQMFPGISWHILQRTYKNDGINRVRTLMPNLYINSDNCDWLMECFESWEYRELTGVEDWAAEPKHDRYSHLMDATRYMAEMIDQIPYIKQNDGTPQKMPSHYRGWSDIEVEEDSWDNMPPGMRPSKFSKLRKKKPSQVYGTDWYE